MATTNTSPPPSSRATGKRSRDVADDGDRPTPTPAHSGADRSMLAAPASYDQLEVWHAHSPESRGRSSLASTSRQASRSIAPFLSRHIPKQYTHLAIADHDPHPHPHHHQSPLTDHPDGTVRERPSTKFCYRHRPDLKCRRQVNEESMEQLQKELEQLTQDDQTGIAHVWALFSAAPAKHRELMLRGVLAQCCFPQLSLLSDTVQALIRIDFLSALPHELGFKVLNYLDTASLCRAAQVSQTWRAMADDDTVWHRMCAQHIDRKCTKCGTGLPLLERQRLRATKRQTQLRASGRGINEWSPCISPAPELPQDQAAAASQPLPSPSVAGPSEPAPTSPPTSTDAPIKTPLESSNSSTKTARKEPPESEIADEPPRKRLRPWKDVYRDRFIVGANWKRGRYTTRVFRGHTNGVTCLQFDDRYLATGSWDATIKIWDLSTGAEIRTLRGHASGIRCLQFDRSKLISGSLDSTIKVWNWRTGECIRTLAGHSDGVLSLHFVGSMLASGSKDGTIRLWNFERMSCFVLRGHQDWVNSVRLDMGSRTLFSTSDDLTIRLWDLDTKAPLRIYKGHVGHVQQVVPLPHEFALDDEDTDESHRRQGHNHGHHHARHDHDTAETMVHHSVEGNGDGGFGDGSDASSSDDGHSIHSVEGNDEASLHDISRPVSAALALRSPVSGLGTAFTAHPTRPLPPRYMLTSGLDNHLRLWDVHTGRCLRTLFGHVEGIWALAADTLRAVSGAQDCMVKVWDARTGRCERTFTGHLGPIACIGLSDSRICTGSEDCEVRMLSFTPEDEYAEPQAAGQTDEDGRPITQESTDSSDRAANQAGHADAETIDNAVVNATSQEGTASTGTQSGAI